MGQCLLCHLRSGWCGCSLAALGDRTVRELRPGAAFEPTYIYQLLTVIKSSLSEKVRGPGRGGAGPEDGCSRSHELPLTGLRGCKAEPGCCDPHAGACGPVAVKLCPTVRPSRAGPTQYISQPGIEKILPLWAKEQEAQCLADGGWPGQCLRGRQHLVTCTGRGGSRQCAPSP